MLRYLTALFTSLCLTTSALASWKIAESQIGDIRDGFQIHKITLQKGESRAVLNLSVFDTKTHRIVVKDFGTEGPSNLAGAAREANAVAGVNGSYFHPDNKPLGLVVTNGVVLNNMERAALLTGVFAANADRPFLLRPKEFKIGPRTIEAIQAGPYLIDKALPVPGLEDTRKARRTFILTDGATQWAVGVCFSTTLAELAEILATPGLLPGLKIERALNLDGGSSSGFWAKRAAQPLYLRELARVRNVLLVIPK